MKWIFNKVFISQNFALFYGYVGFMILCIIVAVILVAKEIEKAK